MIKKFRINPYDRQPSAVSTRRTALNRLRLFWRFCTNNETYDPREPVHHASSNGRKT